MKKALLFLTLICFALPHGAKAMGEREKPEQCTHMYVKMHDKVFGLPKIISPYIENGYNNQIKLNKSCHCTEQAPCSTTHVTIKRAGRINPELANIWISLYVANDISKVDSYHKFRNEKAITPKNEESQSIYNFQRIDDNTHKFWLVSNNKVFTPQGNPLTYYCSIKNYQYYLDHDKDDKSLRATCSTSFFWDGLQISYSNPNAFYHPEKMELQYHEVLSYLEKLQVNTKLQ